METPLMQQNMPGDVEEEMEYEEIEVEEEVEEEVIEEEEVHQPVPVKAPSQEPAPSSGGDGLDIDNLPFCEQCRLLYDQFTSDDGELGIEGLDRFLRSLGQESTIQELRSLMAEWGDKKAGKMTYENFLDMVERQQESWKAVDELTEENQLLLFQSFKLFDLNRDGTINVTELQTALELAGAKLSESECLSFFRHADRNDDGAIALDEWMIFMSDVDFSTLRR